MTSVPDTAGSLPRRGGARIVRLAVSVVLLGWLATRIPPEQAWQTARLLRPAPVLAAVVAIVLGQVLRAARTCALLRGGIRAPDVRAMLRMQMLAFLPGMLSPAKAGELLKVELLRREWDVSLARGAGAFLVERLADVALLGLGAAWGLGAVFGRAVPALFPATVAGILLGAGVAAWVWRAGLLPDAAAARVRAARADVRWIPVAATTAAYWSLVVGIVWLFAESAGGGVGFFALAGAVPLSLLSALLPVSIGGFGVREGAMVLLFQHEAVGCPAGQALAIALLYDAVGLGVPALLGLAYVLAGPRRA